MPEKLRREPFEAGGTRNGPPVKKQPATNSTLDNAADYVPPADDSAPQLLQDMRHVYQNADPRHDKFGGQKAQRSFMTKNPSAFNAQMAAMEDTHRDRMEAQRQASAAWAHPTDGYDQRSEAASVGRQADGPSEGTNEHGERLARRPLGLREPLRG